MVTAFQGVDTAIYPHRGPHPPLTALFKKHFVVFSGGKLEYRKGQDMVVAAFLRFQRRVAPEAVLVTAWHTLYPALFAGLQVLGHVSPKPETLKNRNPNAPKAVLVTAWHTQYPALFAGLQARIHLSLLI